MSWSEVTGFACAYCTGLSGFQEQKRACLPVPTSAPHKVNNCKTKIVLAKEEGNAFYCKAGNVKTEEEKGNKIV